MPNWKKVITSGSIAALSSLYVNTSITGSTISASSGITGSLFGTASWAVSASWAPGGSGLSGGTLNYIPLWSSSTTLTSSVLYQSGSSIGINTTSPSYKLDVSGTGRFYGGSTAGAIFGAGATINLASDAYMLATSTSGKNAGYTANRFSTAEYASFDLITGANISTGWSMQMIPAQTRLDFVDRTTSVPAITILTGGNVGINTTFPSYSLDVSGSGRFTNTDKNAELYINEASVSPSVNVFNFLNFT
jgi:hypothetical protein